MPSRSAKSEHVQACIAILHNLRSLVHESVLHSICAECKLLLGGTDAAAPEYAAHPEPLRQIINNNK